MEIIGVVENGQVRLPPSIKLPNGAIVRVIVEEGVANTAPFEKEPLDEGDVESDVRWATGRRFAQ